MLTTVALSIGAYLTHVFPLLCLAVVSVALAVLQLAGRIQPHLSVGPEAVVQRCTVAYVCSLAELQQAS